jgi:hypothetical protein
MILPTRLLRKSHEKQTHTSFRDHRKSRHTPPFATRKHQGKGSQRNTAKETDTHLLGAKETDTHLLGTEKKQTHTPFAETVPAKEDTDLPNIAVRNYRPLMASTSAKYTRVYVLPYWI